MNNFPTPNIPGCTIRGVDDLTLLVQCRNESLQQPYANACQQIYYSNGRLECIPTGSYHKVCENIRIVNNELVATCKDGSQNPKTVHYDMGRWPGMPLSYANGILDTGPIPVVERNFPVKVVHRKGRKALTTQ